eukprot:CAMPEP_0168335594 /NCGR_PEP_ID=MMETSP0213-20121227/11006_1 /TAXON_ID=151035 /ORGANISM="Euplotes harpa, Strain FSP1.4" /LENGTH=202 /DNA_ID=CAMNT_0008340559 /DNA_START=6 /DNA_END=611 /DNA_ORIENTATION=+
MAKEKKEGKKEKEKEKEKEKKSNKHKRETEEPISPKKQLPKDPGIKKAVEFEIVNRNIAEFETYGGPIAIVNSIGRNFEVKGGICKAIIAKLYKQDMIESDSDSVENFSGLNKNKKTVKMLDSEKDEEDDKKDPKNPIKEEAKEENKKEDKEDTKENQKAGTDSDSEEEINTAVKNKANNKPKDEDQEEEDIDEKEDDPPEL